MERIVDQAFARLRLKAFVTRFRLLPTFLTAFFTAEADFARLLRCVPHFVILSTSNKCAVLFASTC
jgi:hypothetical protein